MAFEGLSFGGDEIERTVFQQGLSLGRMRLGQRSFRGLSFGADAF